MDEKLKRHFFNLYCMAVSDTTFAPKERVLLYRIGQEKGISEDELNAAILNADLKKEIPDTLERKVEFLYDLARMAWADGVIDEAEVSLLKKYVIAYGFLPENAAEIVSYLLDRVKNDDTFEQILSDLK